MDKQHPSEFDPQFVDEQIAQMRQQAGSATPDATLIDDLYGLHNEDLQIRDQVWARLNRMAATAREQQPLSNSKGTSAIAKSASFTRQEDNQPETPEIPEIPDVSTVSDIAEYQASSISRKERKTMETGTWGMNSPTPRGTAKKRRTSVLRVVGIGLVAAVALVTILSFTVFSNVFRPASQATGKPSTVTGAKHQPQQQQAPQVISNGKQVCTLNAGSKTSINGAPWSAGLDWSSQGQLVVGTYSSFKAYTAKSCSPITSFQPDVTNQAVGALWSPDGSKLLVAYPTNINTTYVLDRNGKTLRTLKGDYIGSGRWSSDSTKIIFPLNDTMSYPQARVAPFNATQMQNLRVSIKAIDVASGNITTLTHLPQGYSHYAWSSDVKTVIIRQMKNARTMTMDLATWDTSQGKLVSNTSIPEPSLGQALSPDGSMLALDYDKKIDIYSTSTWKLLASFDSQKPLGAKLAWSPNGNYLAEAAQSIKIFDVAGNKLAATFGQVDAQHTITDLVWSPDGTGLATSSMVLSNDQPSDLSVDVWALS